MIFLLSATLTELLITYNISAMKEVTIEDYLEEHFAGSDKYEIEKIRKDWAQKEVSAQGVLVDLMRRAGEVKGKKVLDMGFGNGVICAAFSRAGAFAYGVEIDKTLQSIAVDYCSRENVPAELRLYDGKTLPFKDNFFDYVYSTSVLEHVNHPDLFLKEAYRVLVPGGKMYLAFPNRFALKDSHSGVYLLGFLPRWGADILLKILGKGSLKNWDLHFLSYFALVRLLRRNDIKFKILMETKGKTKFREFIKKSLASLGIHYGAILSHIIVILEK